MCPFSDRCINSCGVLRYRTSRGWISELTRDQGRENIAEILDVTVRTSPPPPMAEDCATEVTRKRIECGVPDLRSVGASIMARLHQSQVSAERKSF